MKIKLSWLLLFILPCTIYAQNYSFDIGTEFSPSNGNNSLNTSSQTVGVRFPLGNKNGVRWMGGVQYKNLLTGNNTSVINNLLLHSVGFHLSYIKKISDKTLMTISVQPSIWSDMQDISGEDFRFNANVHFLTRKSETFSIGWGIAYAYQFFGNQIIPIIDIRFKKKTGQFKIGGALPLKPKVEYEFNKNTSVGIKLEGNYYSYRLSTQLNSQYLFYRQWDAGLFINQRLGGKWFLNAGAGYAFSRSLQIFDKDQTIPLSFFGNKVAKKYTPAYSNQSNGMIFKIGVQFKLFNEE